MGEVTPGKSTLVRVNIGAPPKCWFSCWFSLIASPPLKTAVPCAAGVLLQVDLFLGGHLHNYERTWPVAHNVTVARSLSQGLGFDLAAPQIWMGFFDGKLFHAGENPALV